MGYVGDGPKPQLEVGDISTKDVTATGDLTVDTNTLFVDSTNNRVGIGTTSPATALDVTGTITADGLTVQGAATTRPTIGNSDVNTSGLTTGLNFEPISNLTNGAKLNVISGLQPTVASAYTAGFEFVTEDHSGGGTFVQTKALTIGASGDISFYEDTGTTPKFFWDASAEALGIGTSSPSEILHLRSAAPAIEFDDSAFATIRGRISSDQGNLLLEADYNNGRNSSNIAFKVDNTERMRIDSSGNVGIGTSSPSSRLDVVGSSQIRQQYTGASNGFLIGQFNSSGDASINNQANANLLLATNNTERLRVDTSGRVLTGKTASNFATTGVELHGDGTGIFTKSSSTPLTINRTTNDGGLVAFYKDGTTVGSISSISGVVSQIILDPRTSSFKGAGLSGGSFDASSGLIAPRDGAGNASDGALDLGGTSSRFRNLRLSGGVYLGGSGSVNYLDDYEEGTWTPSITGPSWASTPWITAVGKYIKVGRQVTVEFILFAKVSGFPTLNSDGNCSLAGLPFTHENDYADGRVWVNLVPVQRLGGVEDGVLNLELFNNNTSGVIRKPNTGGVYQTSLRGTDIELDSRISGSFTYISS